MMPTKEILKKERVHLHLWIEGGINGRAAEVAEAAEAA